MGNTVDAQHICARSIGTDGTGSKDDSNVVPDRDIAGKEVEQLREEWDAYEEDRPSFLDGTKSFAWLDGSIMIQREICSDKLRRFYVHFMEMDVRPPDHMSTDFDVRWGRLRMHIRALKHAKKMNWNTVAIWQDDFRWTITARMLKTVSWVCSKIDFFDVIMLSANVRRRPNFDADGMFWKESPRGLRRVVEASGMSGYIVHKRFYESLIAIFERVIERCKAKSVRPHHCSHVCRGDRAWQSLQDKTHIWLTLYPTMSRCLDEDDEREQRTRDRVAEIFNGNEGARNADARKGAESEEENSECYLM